MTKPNKPSNRSRFYLAERKGLTHMKCYVKYPNLNLRMNYSPIEGMLQMILIEAKLEDRFNSFLYLDWENN